MNDEERPDGRDRETTGPPREGRANDARGPAAGAAGGGAEVPGARRRLPWLGIVAVLVAAIVAIYIWKLVAVSDVRGEMTAVRDSLHARAVRALDDRTQELLRLSAVPLGWAVRSEMLRRNYEQANAFLTEFVQEPGVERVVLGVPRDSILLATDKSLEGARFSSHFPAELLRRTEAEVAAADEGGYRIAVPILGPTRSLGVLVAIYRPERVPLLPSEGAAEGEPRPADAGRPTLPGLHATIRPSIAEATQVKGLAR